MRNLRSRNHEDGDRRATSRPGARPRHVPHDALPARRLPGPGEPPVVLPGAARPGRAGAARGRRRRNPRPAPRPRLDRPRRRAVRRGRRRHRRRPPLALVLPHRSGPRRRLRHRDRQGDGPGLGAPGTTNPGRDAAEAAGRRGRLRAPDHPDAQGAVPDRRQRGHPGDGDAAVSACGDGHLAAGRLGAPAQRADPRRGHLRRGAARLRPPLRRAAHRDRRPAHDGRARPPRPGLAGARDLGLRPGRPAPGRRAALG